VALVYRPDMDCDYNNDYGLCRAKRNAAAFGKIQGYAINAGQ